MSQRFSHLVFDLDDTLIDTTGLLIPQASLEACEAMIAAGLSTDTKSCMLARNEIAQAGARSEIFTALTARFGVRPGHDARTTAQAGFDRFYDRQVEVDITLFPAAREMLRDLRTRYSLHLVTAGNKRTQNAKVNALKLQELFDSISVVEVALGQRKGEAFSRIQSTSPRKSEEYLSIGNRLDSEIADAKKLNWMTCWVRYGEHANDKPQNQAETPDFTIETIEELIATCRL